MAADIAKTKNETRREADKLRAVVRLGWFSGYRAECLNAHGKRAYALFNEYSRKLNLAQAKTNSSPLRLQCDRHPGTKGVKHI